MKPHPHTVNHDEGQADLSDQCTICGLTRPEHGKFNQFATRLTPEEEHRIRQLYDGMIYSCREDFGSTDLTTGQGAVGLLLAELDATRKELAAARGSHDRYLQRISDLEDEVRDREECLQSELVALRKELAEAQQVIEVQKRAIQGASEAYNALAENADGLREAKHQLFESCQLAQAQIRNAQEVMQQFGHIYPDGFPGDWTPDGSKLASQVTFLCNHQRTGFQYYVELVAKHEQLQTELAQALKERDEGLRYLGQLLHHRWPQLNLLEDLYGRCTQIDNGFVVGLQRAESELTRKTAALEKAKEFIECCVDTITHTVYCTMSKNAHCNCGGSFERQALTEVLAAIEKLERTEP